MSDMYRTRTMDQISEGDIGAQLNDRRMGREYP